MKSYNHLFEKLVSRENIIRAIDNSSKRKKKRKDVQRILNNKEKYVEKIRNMLLNEKFEPQEHRLIKIFDKSSKKERFIIQPYFHRNNKKEEIFEQTIHHAVIQILEPIFMKGMYKFSCGSIPKRGGHYGKRYIEKYIREHNDNSIKYCCKLDFHHFYMSVNIDILKEKFRKTIHDKRMLNIIFAILDSNNAHYEEKNVSMGLPIGFYSSQWFANWFLQDLDHFIKEKLKVKCYVRYVDDVVMFGKNKKELHKAFKEVQKYAISLKLEIKSNYQVFKFEDNKKSKRMLDFMGFRFYRNRTTLRKSILLNSTKKARKIAKRENVTCYDASQILSYLGWYKATKTFQYFQKEILTRVNINLCKKLISRKNKGEKNGIQKIKKHCQTSRN